MEFGKKHVLIWGSIFLLLVGLKHVLIWGSIFLLLVGLVLAIEQLYIMSAVLALLAPTSFLLSRGTLGALSVRREAPGLMKEGQQRRVRLTVSNEGVRRRYFFTIGDTLPDGLEAVGEGSGGALVPPPRRLPGRAGHARALGPDRHVQLPPPDRRGR